MVGNYARRPRRKSLAIGITAAMALVMAAVIVVGAVTAYLVLKRGEEQLAARSLATYATERALRESQRFDDLARLQQRANGAFIETLGGLDPARVDADFDRLFPLQPDGTRRSIAGLYDGMSMADGSRVHGIGAFIADGTALTPAEKAQLLAALLVISRFGEGIGFRFDNFYFFTPKNRLVMFAPTRPDRLLFYRRDAAATFGFAFEEMVQITLPAANPAGAMRCTGLQHILYDRSFRTWTTGCMTPAKIGGAYVGAWGVSLPLDQLIAQSIEKRPPGTENMILTGDGKLIAHRFLTEQGSEKTEAYLDIADSGDARLKRVAQFAESARESLQVAYSEEDDRYIAAAPLKGPDWRFVVMTSGHAVRMEALTETAKITAIVLAGAAAVLLALRYLLLLRLERPLGAMIEALDRLDAEGAETFRARLPVKRSDEIGALARRLARKL